MGAAAPIITSFNAGELSPSLGGRVEIAKYPNGCRTLENLLMTVQGPVKRRGGTRYIAPVKDSAQKTWLQPFVFSVNQAYLLEFGHQYIRFFTNHGRVNVSGVTAWVTATAYVPGDLRSNGGINYYCKEAHTSGTFATDLAAGKWYALTGTIYEIPSPYTSAELTASDGTFNLRLIQSNDVIYIACATKPPQKLSRFSATKWTITTLTPVGGPFKKQNITTTAVYSSAKTGSVTLTADANVWQAGHVGSLFYLGQKSVISVKQWEAGKSITINSLRRSDGKNYEALNAATTGGGKPVHTEGAVYDGDSGVQWQFRDPGYGVVLITGFTSATVVTGTVISDLPDNAVLVANKSTRWAYGAWSDVEGWPSQVTFFKERLVFGAGSNIWLSVAGDYETFTSKDAGGVVTADSAISITLQSARKNNLLWFASGDSLICGTAGAEFAIKSVTDQQPFGPENVTAPEVSQRGSRSVVPVIIGDVALFVQQSGLKLRDFQFDSISLKFLSSDQNTLADHITKSGIIAMSYQQEPNSVVWAALANGNLVAMTYSREQYENAPFGGWHKHPIGGSFGTGRAVVESLATIPAPNLDRDETWLIVKRTINGATVRYIEYMEYEFDQNDDNESAFFVDSGLSLDNVKDAILTPGVGADVVDATGVLFATSAPIFSVDNIGKELIQRYSYVDPVDEKTIIWESAKAEITEYVNTQNVICKINKPFLSTDNIPALGWKMTTDTLTGLDHLEGELIDVLVDGATHPQVEVVGGAVNLEFKGSRIALGFNCRARLQPMRLNAGAQNGTSQGKTARVNKLFIRLLSTLGLSYGSSFDNMYQVDFRNALDLMDNPPPLFTGDLKIDWPGDYDSETSICFEQPDPLPCTIIAIMPQVSVYD